MDLPETLSWRNSTSPVISDATESKQFASANRRRARLSKRYDNLRTGTKPLTQAEENQLFVKQMQIQMFMRSIGLSRPEAERFWTEHYTSPPEESSVDDQCLERQSGIHLTVNYARPVFCEEEYTVAQTFSCTPPKPVVAKVVISSPPVDGLEGPIHNCPPNSDASAIRHATQYSAVLALSLIMRLHLAVRILTRLVPSRYVCGLLSGQSVCQSRAYSSALPIT